MDCVFCGISSGEVQASKVYEDSTCMAFFEINPACPGHLVVIPKKHYEDLVSIPAEEFLNVWSVVRFLSEIVDEHVKPKGYNVLLNVGKVKNQQSKHLAVHVLPLKGKEEIVVGWKPQKLDETDAKALAGKIAVKLQERVDQAKKEIIKHQDELIKVIKRPKRLNP
jgi:histidine triad (HIT) family protein